MENSVRSAAGKTTDDMDSLKTRHQELESQLAALDAQLSLSPREQAERSRLKKEKLAIKDRMAVIAAAAQRR